MLGLVKETMLVNLRVPGRWGGGVKLYCVYMTQRVELRGGVVMVTYIQ